MVTAVKSLSTLLCDPHLMKEAISFLHSLSISQTFCLSHLYLRAADKAGFSTAESSSVATMPSRTSLGIQRPNASFHALRNSL